MRLDKYVHGHPNFYEWKLEKIKATKTLIYRLLLLDKKISNFRNEIERQNKSLTHNYFSGKKVLEVGCGRGSFLTMLHEREDCKCVGVDISQEMIEFARENNPGPEYSVMDSADLQFHDNEFDVVVFNYVLHHVKELEQCISEVKRIGKVIVFYECCAWEKQPLKALSKFYWKITDGGYEYLSLDEWKERFALPVLDEIRGAGLVRYGMCVLNADSDTA